MHGALLATKVLRLLTVVWLGLNEEVVFIHQFQRWHLHSIRPVEVCRGMHTGGSLAKRSTICFPLRLIGVGRLIPVDLRAAAHVVVHHRYLVVLLVLGAEALVGVE